MNRLSIESKGIWRVIAAIPLFVLLLYPVVSVGDGSVSGRLKKLKEQYQNINTLHVKSQIVISAYSMGAKTPLNGKGAIRQIHNEYWADKNGHYRINSSFYDSNGVPIGIWEIAYDGNLFQLFDKRSLLFSCGSKDRQQNPIAPENPLFAPLQFLKQENDNCQACPLKLTDVIDTEKWDEKIGIAKVVVMSDQKAGQMVIETPKNLMEGKESVSRVYLGDIQDYLPLKTNVVDANGNIITSTEITAYNIIVLNGKQTYWPKSVRFSGKDAQAELNTDAEVEVCQINECLPPDIFTVDSSSARSIWDDDDKKFVH